MKRLVKKSDVLSTSFSFAQVRQYINEKNPYVLFGLDLDEQQKLSVILDSFENAVKEASSYSKLGMPNLEVGSVDMNILAYYLPGSNTLTINADKFDELFLATIDYIDMIGVHEYGHYVDEKLGDISQTSNWTSALQNVDTNYLDGYDVTESTNENAENFANAFVALSWGAQQDSCTEFIEQALFQ
ncbi:hypothetical protein D3C81_603940 [compost metagenome]